MAYDMPSEDRLSGKIGASLPLHEFNDTFTTEGLDNDVYWGLNRLYNRALVSQKELCDILRYTGPIYHAGTGTPDDKPYGFTRNQKLNAQLDLGYRTYTYTIPLGAINFFNTKVLKILNCRPRKIRNRLPHNVIDSEEDVIRYLRHWHHDKNNPNGKYQKNQLKDKTGYLQAVKDGFEGSEYDWYVSVGRESEYMPDTHTPDYYFDYWDPTNPSDSIINHYYKIRRQWCTEANADEIYYMERGRYPFVFNIQDTYKYPHVFTHRLMLFIDGWPLSNVMFIAEPDRITIAIPTSYGNVNGDVKGKYTVDTYMKDSTVYKYPQGHPLEKYNDDLPMIDDSVMKSWINYEKAFTLLGFPHATTAYFNGSGSQSNFVGNRMVRYSKKPEETKAFFHLYDETPKAQQSNTWLLTFSQPYSDAKFYGDFTITNLVQKDDALYFNLPSDVITNQIKNTQNLFMEAFSLKDIAGISTINKARDFTIPLNGNPIPPENILIFQLYNDYGGLRYISNARISLFYPNVYRISNVDSGINLCVVWFHSNQAFKDKAIFDNPLKEYMAYNQAYSFELLNKRLPSYVTDYIPATIEYDYKDAEAYGKSSMADKYDYRIEKLTELMNDNPDRYEYIYRMLMERTKYKLHANPKQVLLGKELNGIVLPVYMDNSIAYNDQIEVLHDEYIRNLEALIEKYGSETELISPYVIYADAETTVPINQDDVIFLNPVDESGYTEIGVYTNSAPNSGRGLLSSENPNGNTIIGVSSTIVPTTRWSENDVIATLKANGMYNENTFQTNLKAGYYDHIIDAVARPLNPGENEFSRDDKIHYIPPHNTITYDNTSYDSQTVYAILFDPVTTSEDLALWKETSWINSFPTIFGDTLVKFNKEHFAINIEHSENCPYHYTTWINGEMVNPTAIVDKAFSTWLFFPVDILIDYRDYTKEDDPDGRYIITNDTIEVEMMRTPLDGRVVVEVDFSDCDTSIKLPKKFKDISPQSLMVSIRKEISSHISNTEVNPNYYSALTDDAVIAQKEYGVNYYYQVAPDYEMQWLLVGKNKYVDGKRVVDAMPKFHEDVIIEYPTWKTDANGVIVTDASGRPVPEIQEVVRTKCKHSRLDDTLDPQKNIMEDPAEDSEETNDFWTTSSQILTQDNENPNKWMYLTTAVNRDFYNSTNTALEEIYEVTVNDEPYVDGFYALERRRFYQYIPYADAADSAKEQMVYTRYIENKQNELIAIHSESEEYETITGIFDGFSFITSEGTKITPQANKFYVDQDDNRYLWYRNKYRLCNNIEEFINDELEFARENGKEKLITPDLYLTPIGKPSSKYVLVDIARKYTRIFRGQGADINGNIKRDANDVLQDATITTEPYYLNLQYQKLLDDIGAEYHDDSKDKSELDTWTSVAYLSNGYVLVHNHFGQSMGPGSRDYDINEKVAQYWLEHPDDPRSNNINLYCYRANRYYQLLRYANVGEELILYNEEKEPIFVDYSIDFTGETCGKPDTKIYKTSEYGYSQSYPKGFRFNSRTPVSGHDTVYKAWVMVHRLNKTDITKRNTVLNDRHNSIVYTTPEKWLFYTKTGDPSYVAQSDEQVRSYGAYYFDGDHEYNLSGMTPAAYQNDPNGPTRSTVTTDSVGKVNELRITISETDSSKYHFEWYLYNEDDTNPSPMMVGDIMVDDYRAGTNEALCIPNELLPNDVTWVAVPTISAPKCFFENRHALIQNTDFYRKYSFKYDFLNANRLVIDHFYDDPSYEKFRVFICGRRMDHGTDFVIDSKVSDGFIRGSALRFEFYSPVNGYSSGTDSFKEATQLAYKDVTRIYAKYVSSTVFFDENNNTIVPQVGLIYIDISTADRREYVWNGRRYLPWDSSTMTVEDAKATVYIEYLPYKEHIVWKSGKLISHNVTIPDGYLRRPLSFAYYDFYLNGVKLTKQNMTIVSSQKLKIDPEFKLFKSRLSIYERNHDPDLLGNDQQMKKSLNDIISQYDSGFRKYLFDNK